MLTFFTARTTNILAKAKFPSGSTNIPNNHKAFDADQLNAWRLIANSLGVDFEQTEYTTRVVKKEGETEIAIYSPYVAAEKGEAVLVWGKVKQPLKSIDASKAALSVVGEKKIYLQVDFGESVDFETLQLVMMIPKATESAPKHIQEWHKKDINGKRTDLVKALRKGTLGDFLTEVFERPKKLGDVLNRELTVVDFELNNFGKYVLTTLEVGKVETNTGISKKISLYPIAEKADFISVEKPAKLWVEPSLKTTDKGYPIYPVTFTLWEEQFLEAFDFGGDTAEVSTEEIDFA